MSRPEVLSFRSRLVLMFTKRVYTKELSISESRIAPGKIYGILSISVVPFCGGNLGRDLLVTATF